MLDGQQSKLKIYTAQRVAGTHTVIDPNTFKPKELESVDKTVLFQAMDREEAKQILKDNYEGEWKIVAEHHPK